MTCANPVTSACLGDKITIMILLATTMSILLICGGVTIQFDTLAALEIVHYPTVTTDLIIYCHHRLLPRALTNSKYTSY